MAKPKKLVPWSVCTPEQVTPNLTDDQKNQIGAAAKAAGISLSTDDWDKVAISRRDYVWCRSAKRYAIEYQVFAARLKHIADAASDLLHALSGTKLNQEEHSMSVQFDTTFLLLMHELADGGSSLQSPLELFAWLLQLRKSAGRALQRTEHWSEQNAWRYDWHGFVNLLASVFEDHSRTVTVHSIHGRDYI